MKLLADECIERSIVNALRANGISVTYISEVELGLSDNGVLEKAKSEGAILLTADKDFGELVYRQGRVTHGVIL